MKKKIANIFVVICIVIAFGTAISIEWLYNSFGNLTMEEIIFHIKVPMKGTNTDMVWEYMKECIWKILLPSVLISGWLLYVITYSSKARENKTIIICVSIAIIILGTSVAITLKNTDIPEYIANQMDESKFIEKEYANPAKVKVKFPEQKRNLIYIFLESMETTFSSKEAGGIEGQDLIPEITKLSKENIDFSTTDKIGGAYVLSGTEWTAGAMTAQTLGVPLKLSVGGNALSEYSTFLSGAYSIGQILENNGYHNFLLLGSDATFGGRRNLFTQHGNYEIWDFESAVEEGKVTEKVWWGYTDDKLFEYAKEKILNLSKQEEPFNFTMLTTDTHFQDGYKCDDCPEKWDHIYKNVISCSSKRVGDFVEWLKEQDFYENTTIVIAGDHLTMQKGELFEKRYQNYDRRVINLIINSAVEFTKEDRKYSTMDLYPTTLAALGAKIEGNKLGLGTNLFSDEITLIEKYGIGYINNELKKLSRFYNNNILVK